MMARDPNSRRNQAREAARIIKKELLEREVKEKEIKKGDDV